MRRSVPCAAMLAAALTSCALPRVQPTPVAPPPTSVYADSGYAPLLDGTLSGNGDLEEDEAPKQPHTRLPTTLDRWFAWKQDFTKRTGLNFGGSYGVLWQNYSSTLVGEYNAVGGKFTFNADYALFNAGKPNALSLDVVVEDRRPLGTELAPLQAGLGSGSITPTAATWGDFSLGVTQLYLRQNLADGRFQYAIGKIFAPNFINAYPFFDDNRQFFNQTFSASPTIAAPLRGFGLVAAWFPVTGSGFYLQSGMYTANSDDTGLTIDDFFTTGQHFYHFDVGWSALAHKGVPIQARGPMDENNFHITGWYRNPVEPIPETHGMAFNASGKVSENVLLFLRGGWSEGWFVDRNLSLGGGWRPAAFASDLFGIGAGWARPTGVGQPDQYTEEVFYRFMLTSNLALTPDVQLIQQPALNTLQSVLWAIGFRARVTF